MKRTEFLSEETNKKQKVDMAEPEHKVENLFTSVGDQAQNIDDESNVDFDDEGIRKTGAMDNQGHPVQEIQSLCMNCHEDGVTRLLLTTIPFFREVIIMSFECQHCGLKNSEIQPASEIQEKGGRYTLRLENKIDFNRQIVKSETASCKFLELDIEIPPKRGQLTNVEGLLSEMVSDLEGDQAARKELQPEIYVKIAEVITKIQNCINCEPGALPLTLTVDDPAGNSWIEFLPGEPAHKWSSLEYTREAQQNVQLGLISVDEVAQREQQDERDEIERNRNPTSTGFISDETGIENFENEVQTFYATCSSCNRPCETHMKVVNIPHFKDVIIMSTVCDHCGYKSNEVKTGGAIPSQGRRITLTIDDAEDLARDILKSETCGLIVPELNLDLTPGTLGGRFTTIEGLLTQVHEELHSRIFTQSSDSMEPVTKQRWTDFFSNLQEAINGKIKFTIVMEDPLAASYIQNVYAPDPDPNMIIEDYERTFEQNEDLGLNDIETN